MKNPLPRLFCAACFFCFTAANVYADYGIDYNYSQQAGTMTFNNSTAGSFSLLAGGADDQLTSFQAPPSWGGFYFGGVWYPQATTTFYVSSNGWVGMRNSARPCDATPPSSLPVNSLAGNPYKFMAPLWDDLRVHLNGEVTWKITGGVTDRTLIVEWRAMCWDRAATDSAISFQVILYDNLQAIAGNRNVIEFRYSNHGAGTAYVNNGSGGASIGISGFCASDVLAFQSSLGNPTKDSPEVSYISAKPSDSVHHIFIPQQNVNDECFNAGPFPVIPSSPLESGRNALFQATQSPGPLPACGSPATVKDIWQLITKPAGITSFEIFADSQDCCGSLYNTGIEFYSACGGAPVTCDFGSTGPAGTNATSYLNMTNLPCAAQQYWVRNYSIDTNYSGYFRFNMRPPGRNCAFATDITPCGIPYSSPLGLSTCGFGNEYDSTFSEPHSPHMHGEDYLFTYTPPATTCVNFSLNNTPLNSNPGLFIYQGCPDVGSCIGSVTGSGGSTLTFNNVTLEAGLQYYFLVDNDSAGGTGCLADFDFQITIASGSPAANDVCAAAINIPVLSAASCTGAIDFNNNCASPTAAGTVPLPGCGNFTDGVTPDVWFTFTSTSVNVHEVKVDDGTFPSAQDMAMAVYTGTCGALTPVNCDNSSNGLMPLLAIVPPAAGTIYYVRLWSNSGTPPGNFRICITDGCSSANDLCSGAIPLTPGQYAGGDNSCATGTNEPLAGTSASCWTNLGAGQLNTVWYSFVATDDTMKIRIHLLSLFDSQMALYSSTGGCGGTFTQLFCNDNALSICGIGANRSSQIMATGLTIGATYYIRVDGTGANTGTFEIIVIPGSSPFPPVYAQDCPLPISLCSNSNIVVANPGYQGSGNYCDVSPGGTCLATGEAQSVFYTFSVTGTGAGTPVEFTITPNATANYDFMLWCIDTVYNGGDLLPAVPDYCSNLVNEGMFPAAVCNFSLQNITGCSVADGLCPMVCYQNYGYADPGMMPAVVVPNGMTATFLLLVNSNSSLTGFTLDWMGTPINGSPQSLIWQNANNSNWNDSTNWNAGACGGVPDCNNGIAAVITNTGVMPVISANTSVSDFTINAGASLTINPGITLSVCGNFTNNGTLICGAGSTVRFIGSRNTFISGTFYAAGNNFYHFEVAKNSGSTLTLNTNIYISGNDSIYGGMLNCNGYSIELNGNFYNHAGNASFSNFLPGTLAFTGQSVSPQYFRNDGSPLNLVNVVMNQAVTGTLILDTNSTSDLIVGFNGSLTLTSGRIVTGLNHEVNILNPSASACSTGNISSYVEGNLRRLIATVASTYDFPVGDAVRGYQRFAVQYTSAPSTVYNILARFRQWVGMPASGPALSECGNSGWNILPPFEHGYWTLDASDTTGLGIYNAVAYPRNILNNVGATFSIMKSISNNGQGPWSMEGLPFCASTSVVVERDSLSSFSDFAIVQSDIGNFLSPLQENDFGISIFPNPAMEKTTVTFKAEAPQKFLLKLNDVTGRTILSENIDAAKGMNSKDISLRGISKGIYLLVLENGNRQEVRKLILN